MDNNMTQGSPAKILLFFSLPMIFSMIFQQLYNIVDSVVAGKFIGVDALAAVGASYPITALFIAVATGASVGCSVVVSQLYGAQDLDQVKSAVCTAVISLTALATVLTVVGIIGCDAMMRFIHTPDNIFTDSALYLRIYFFGLLFLFLYNTATAIFNGLGDSRTPLVFLIFSSLFNIYLDILFVKDFHMGVAGLAWATFLAQGSASLLAVIYLIYRVVHIKTGRPYKKFSTLLLSRMAGVAVPSICQQSFVSVGVFFVQGLINSFGSTTVAGFSAALKIYNLALMTIGTIPNAFSSYVAQNIGARNIPRVREGLRVTLILVETMAIATTVAVLLFARQFVGMFVSGGDAKAVIDTGCMMLYIVAPFFPFIEIKNCCDSVLRGSGDMREFMATTFADLLLRVLLSFVLVRGFHWGFEGICWAYPMGWIVGIALSVYYYKRGAWQPVNCLASPREKQ